MYFCAYEIIDLNGITFLISIITYYKNNEICGKIFIKNLHLNEIFILFNY